MNFFRDLQNADFNNLGAAPLSVRLFVIVVLGMLILGAGYWFDTQHQIDELKRIQAKESELKREFESKQQKAANLEAYREQLAQMEKTFGDLLRQLPSKQEVENLIVDVTQTALASGLENRQIKPLAEVQKDFYAELPYDLNFIGSYHETADFISNTAALPRIVTLHDFTLTSQGSKGKEAGEDTLTLNIRAQTYRYLDDEEVEK